MGKFANAIAIMTEGKCEKCQKTVWFFPLTPDEKLHQCSACTAVLEDIKINSSNPTTEENTTEIKEEAAQ